MALKLWPAPAGLPDRLMLLPTGGVWFVEFKSPSGRVSPIQRRIFDILGKLGHPVDIIDSVELFKVALAAKLES